MQILVQLKENVSLDQYYYILQLDSEGTLIRLGFALDMLPTSHLCSQGSTDSHFVFHLKSHVFVTVACKI